MKLFMMFFLVGFSVLRVKSESNDNSMVWDFSRSGRDHKITIMINDTLFRDIPVIRYREFYSSNPLLNVDLCLDRQTRTPLSFFITAVGENVHVCDSARYYSVSRTFNSKEQFFSIDYDTVAYPFYGRYAIPLLKTIDDNHEEKLYMAKGYTITYNFKMCGEENLSVNGTDVACIMWELSSKIKNLPFQPVDILWIRKNPPNDLLQIKMNVKGGRFFGLTFGNRNAIYKRIL